MEMFYGKSFTTVKALRNSRPQCFVYLRHSQQYFNYMANANMKEDVQGQFYILC